MICKGEQRIWYCSSHFYKTFYRTKVLMYFYKRNARMERSNKLSTGALSLSAIFHICVRQLMLFQQ